MRQAVFLQRASTPEIRFDARTCRSARRCYCDARQVGQALINLLKNAAESIQGRDARGAAGRDRRRGRTPAPQQMAVSVADNGRGLPSRRPRAADRALCHDPRQGHRPWPRHRQKDHGRSSRRVAARRSARGAVRGVRLVFIAPGAAAERRTARGEGEGGPWRMTILVVDDEADIRALICGILNDEGYETRGAGDQRRGAGGDPRAPAVAGDSRHLAARQRTRRAGDPEDRPPRRARTCRC